MTSEIHVILENLLSILISHIYIYNQNGEYINTDNSLNLADFYFKQKRHVDFYKDKFTDDIIFNSNA